MTSYKYKKLRGRIVEKYGTQEDFAKAIGISKNAMSRKMTGKAGISQEDIRQWCQILEIQISEIGEYFFC